MTSSVDFDKYWGVRLSTVECDFKSMCMTFNLFWTIDSKPYRSRLRFKNISRCELLAERVFESEVVELVSIEGKRVDAGWQVAGELSNYEFSILCADIQEEAEQ